MKHVSRLDNETKSGAKGLVAKVIIEQKVKEKGFEVLIIHKIV
jgi:hypothetical protein